MRTLDGCVYSVVFLLHIYIYIHIRAITYVLLLQYRLGLFSEDAPMARCGTPIDSLTAHLAKELQYGERERDLVVLHHEVCFLFVFLP